MVTKQFSVKEIAPCLFAIFVDILGFGLVAPLLVAIFASSHSNVFHLAGSSHYVYLGISLALYPLFMFFGTAYIGALSDEIGRKKTLLLSMLGIGIGFLLMTISIFFPNIWLFLFARALSGFFSASQSVALATIVDLSNAENKAIHLSYVALIQCLGFVLGPLAGGFLSTFAFYWPFFGTFIAAVIAFLWIKFFFQETFVVKKEKKKHAVKFFSIFAEVYRNKRVLHLSLVFLLMQMGVSLYLPIILILFTKAFHYSPLWLGLFNGYLGIGFTVGLVGILPLLLKRLQVEKIVYLALFFTAGAQGLSGFFPGEISLWVFAFPFAIAVQTAFTGMFTSFSNAVNKESQGWVMGISVAIMAIAWACIGFFTQLIPYLGTEGLILIGSGFLLISAVIMHFYLKKY